VLAVLEPGREGDIDGNTIRQHVQSHVDRGEISRWALPERVEIVATIDKTSVGKIDKKRLRARYDTGKS
jgi:fatty-acyl-CoA synthase